jgi:hypothetical protein
MTALENKVEAVRTALAASVRLLLAELSAQLPEPDGGAAAAAAREAAGAAAVAMAAARAAGESHDDVTRVSSGWFAFVKERLAGAVLLASSPRFKATCISLTTPFIPTTPNPIPPRPWASSSTRCGASCCRRSRAAAPRRTWSQRRPPPSATALPLLWWLMRRSLLIWWVML